VSSFGAGGVNIPAQSAGFALPAQLNQSKSGLAMIVEPNYDLRANVTSVS
jgi:hypothetical protein